MGTEDKKLLALGKTIWSRITDIAVMPARDQAYSRMRVTFPGGSVEVIIARKQVADAMEEIAAMRFNIRDVHEPKEGGKPS